MNLNHLHYFRVLAEHEHYTKAAKYLSITQPSLSHAISLLEKDLGVALFEKQGRNIRLTKYGHFFLSYVERGLDELSLGEEKLKELAGHTRGNVKLGFMDGLGSNVIPSLIQEFSKQENYPIDRFSFGQNNSLNLIKDLKNGNYDLILCSYIEEDSDIEFIPIAPQEFVLIVSKENPMANQNEVDFSEIAHHSFISLPKHHELRQLVEHLFEIKNIQCEVNDYATLIGLVNIDYGVAILPKTFVENQPGIKVLKLINLQSPSYFYLAFNRHQVMIPTTHAFKEFIINQMKHNLLKKV